MKGRLIAIACSVLLTPGWLSATTWVPAQKTDPVSGEKINVHEIASSGSYIYQWPSKYDLVFWPFTNEQWIWFSSTSGYASFGSDFEKLSDAERSRLSVWLKENYNSTEQPTGHLAKLRWLERVYAQRDMPSSFWSMFYRLMAYMYAQQKQDDKSLEYVSKAIPLIEKQLSEKEGTSRLEALYLMGEYQRRLGNTEEALRYFALVKSEPFQKEDGTTGTGHPYFVSLVENRQRIIDGRDPEDR